MQRGVIAADDGVGRLGLRPETPADDDFVLALYASTRAAEMDVTGWAVDQQREFLRWQFELQRRHYRQHYADATFDVLTLDDVPIGRVYALFKPREIRLMEMTIEPRFRGRGFGTQVVLNLLDEARRLNASVTLHVEPHNPALLLYQRLGFTIVEERGANLFLEWRSDR
jgi:ribosomal protein S18 acetylase RimI-like enzyme